MTRTLLELCQDVATRCGFSEPGTVIGNRDATAKRLLSCANEAGRVLSTGKVYNAQGQIVSIHDWADLRKEQEFTTVAAQQAYSLQTGGIITDEDYTRIISDTLWDRTNDRPIRVVDPATWQKYVSGVVTLGINKLAIIRRKQILFYTTPTSADTYAFEYISSKWVDCADGTDRVRFNADGDTTYLDDHLMYLSIRWRFKEATGLEYAEDKLEYLEEALAVMGGENPDGTIHLGHEADYMPNLPDIGYGA